MPEALDYLVVRSGLLGYSISDSKARSLLYYAQAWWVALCDEKLFRGPIEATEDGPVLACGGVLNAPGFDDGVREHLDLVLERYGAMGAAELAQLSRTEAPWLVARARIPIDGKLLVRNYEMALFYRYCGGDIVTRAAIYGCFAWAAIEQAFGLSPYMSTL